jgi:alpha-tubulin suppressor-like RCC1 family protein
LYSCGKGEYGRLGNGSDCSATLPKLVNTSPLSSSSTSSSENETPATSIVQVSAGGSHTVWLDEHNHIFTAGRGDGGRLGAGKLDVSHFNVGTDITNNIFPHGTKTILQVSAGGAHTLVLVDFPNHNDIDFFYLVKTFQNDLERKAVDNR